MRKNGFTLIEVLVTVSILAIVAAGLSMTINTILNTYDIARDKSVLLRQVERTGYWISEDIQRVESPPPNLNGFPVQINCYTGDDIADTDAIQYQIIADDTNHKIYRSVNGGSSMMIAEYIDIANTSIATATDNVTGDKYYNLTVSATYNNKVEESTFTIKPRVQ
jgi:prepilin-type N-terminal cleavage/methylation domain-containing protein